MQDKKMSPEEKEKLRKMLKEQSYERLEQVGRSAAEERASSLLGGLGGQKGFAALTLLLGVLYILGGSILLSRNASWGWFYLVPGVFLLFLGIQNFRKSSLEMLKVNGVALIIIGIPSLPVGLLPIGFGIYFLSWHRKRVRYERSRERE